LRGSIISYVKEKTPKNILLGRIHEAEESYGVTKALKKHWGAKLIPVEHRQDM